MPVGTRVLGRGLTLASTARATLPCPETDDILPSHPVCHNWRWENERQCCKQPSIKWNSKLEKKRKEDQARPVSLMGFWGCGAGLCTARRRDTVVRPLTVPSTLRPCSGPSSIWRSLGGLSNVGVCLSLNSGLKATGQSP